MFDWNDEELSNIIWGEEENGDDNIISLPEGKKLIKKELTGDGAAAKLTGQKTLGVRTGHGFADTELDNSSNFEKDGKISSSGVSMDSWPDISSSNISKKENEALISEVSTHVSEPARCEPGKVSATAHSDRENQFFENPQGEEQNDFSEYGWESIGSFDDLDRIFSNEEPLFGNVLDNADELWCSKHNSSLSSLYTSGDSGGGPLNLACGKLDDSSSVNFQHCSMLLDHSGQGKDQNKNAMKLEGNISTVGPKMMNPRLDTDNPLALSSDKVPRQKKHYKGQKKQERRPEGKTSRDLYCAWPSAGNLSGQYEHHHQLAPSVVQSCAPPAMSQLRHLPGLDSFHYQHIPNPYMYPPLYSNVPNPFPVSPSTAHCLHSGSLNGQAMISGFDVSPEVNPTSKQVDSSDKPPTMTPQEKIEKLRRRQQMQAMLAIQKQQEQFSSQISYSIAKKGPLENQSQPVKGADFEIDDMSALPSSVCTSSAVEQDDSNMISVAVADFAAEEIVLRKLQDVIAKLDSEIRLCIRDSLFRLAKSALQRHYTSDTSSTNTRSKDEIESLSKEDKNANPRDIEMPDVETETNPIDRAVAHLLFHRPLEPSAKHSGTPDSPHSSKLQGESKASAATNLWKGIGAEQGGCRQGQKGPQNTLKKGSICSEISENASSIEAGGSGALGYETSQ